MADDDGDDWEDLFGSPFPPLTASEREASRRETLARDAEEWRLHFEAASQLLDGRVAIYCRAGSRAIQRLADGAREVEIIVRDRVGLGVFHHVSPRPRIVAPTEWAALGVDAFICPWLNVEHPGDLDEVTAGLDASGAASLWLVYTEDQIEHVPEGKPRVGLRTTRSALEARLPSYRLASVGERDWIHRRRLHLRRR